MLVFINNILELFNNPIIIVYFITSFIIGSIPFGLILSNISGYGDIGPQGNLPGYDFLLQAESGLMKITGNPNGQPMKLGVAIVDIVTGLNAVISILSGLILR